MREEYKRKVIDAYFSGYRTNKGVSIRDWFLMRNRYRQSLEIQKFAKYITAG